MPRRDAEFMKIISLSKILQDKDFIYDRPNKKQELKFGI